MEFNFSLLAQILAILGAIVYAAGFVFVCASDLTLEKNETLWESLSKDIEQRTGVPREAYPEWFSYFYPLLYTFLFALFWPLKVGSALLNGGNVKASFKWEWLKKDK